MSSKPLSRRTLLFSIAVERCHDVRTIPHRHQFRTAKEEEEKIIHQRDITEKRKERRQLLDSAGAWNSLSYSHIVRTFDVFALLHTCCERQQLLNVPRSTTISCLAGQWLEHNNTWCCCSSDPVKVHNQRQCISPCQRRGRSPSRPAARAPAHHTTTLHSLTLLLLAPINVERAPRLLLVYYTKIFLLYIFAGFLPHQKTVLVSSQAFL